MAQKCNEGYSGNLCHSCLKDPDVLWARSNKNDCVKCDGLAMNILKISGVAVGFLAFVFFLIGTNLKGTLKNIDHIVLLRILTTYF